MTSWLKTQFLPLTADPTDKFLEENKIEDKTDIEDKKENEEKVDKSELLLRRSPRKSVKSDVPFSKMGTIESEMEMKRQVEESEGSPTSAHSPRKSGKSEVSPKKRQVEKSEGSPMSAHSPHKLLKFEGTPGSNQYLSNRVGSSRKDASGEKTKRLEEDVRSLRRKYRKLEDHIIELENTSRTGQLVNESSDDSLVKPVVTVVKPVVTVELDQTVEQTKIVNKTVEQDITVELDVEAVVAKGVGVHNKFKNLCLYFFTSDELCSGTRTGKRTIKCMDEVKPQLNQNRFQQLESCVVSKYSLYDKETFIKKLKICKRFCGETKKKELSNKIQKNLEKC